jgi:uncharacterized lipoprotein YddW (UPF0748 family)
LVLCSAALLAVAPLCAQPPEHRGLWVGTNTFNTPAEVAAVVDKAAAAHLNALYPIVWYNGGQAWFKSSLSPLAERVAPDFDPLGCMIGLAHAKGLQVHAWFVCGSYGWATKGVFDEHPDWALQPLRPSTQRWYDLGKPEVRQFETDVMLDCLRRYDVDGLHFDYIRYHDTGYCYCDTCQGEFARRTGLPPLRQDQATFPIVLSLSANPLAGPTTAQVLASFDDGLPAVALNRLGAGEAALLNWQAAGSPHAALDALLKTLLQRFGATRDNLYQLRTTQTAAKYSLNYQTAGADWLKALGLPPKVIDETKLDQVPPQGTIALFSQYYIDEPTAAKLEQFVQGGGHAVFVDGPVFGIKFPALQRVLGLKSTAPYFRGPRAIKPAPNQDLLTVGPDVDLAAERTRLEKWVEYRKWTVTELVRAVYTETKRLKPQAQVSAAVFYNRKSADAVCQDWYNWLQDGIIDYVLPMAYLMENAKLQEALAEWHEADPQFARIIPGLSLYQQAGGAANSRPRDLVLSQIALCRSNGARGNLFFASNYLNDDLIAAMSAGPYALPAPIYLPTKRP